MVLNVENVKRLYKKSLMNLSELQVNLALSSLATKVKQSNILLQRGFGYPALKQSLLQNPSSVRKQPKDFVLKSLTASSLCCLINTQLKKHDQNIRYKASMIYNSNILFSFVKGKTSSDEILSPQFLQFYSRLNRTTSRLYNNKNISTSVDISMEDLVKLNKNQKKKNLIPVEYLLENFHRSNQDTCLVQKPTVLEGDWVETGDLLADGSASIGGELALGQNILIAYMPWEGYNYEDAILISERLVYDDVYTSVHIERYETEIRETKFGKEKITRELPDVFEKDLKHLNNLGVCRIGTFIEEGAILVGKITPINQKNQSPYQKLLYTLLEKKFTPYKENSLRAPKGIKAKVINVYFFEKQKENQQIRASYVPKHASHKDKRLFSVEKQSKFSFTSLKKRQKKKYSNLENKKKFFLDFSQKPLISNNFKIALSPKKLNNSSNKFENYYSKESPFLPVATNLTNVPKLSDAKQKLDQFGLLKLESELNLRELPGNLAVALFTQQSNNLSQKGFALNNFIIKPSKKNYSKLTVEGIIKSNKNVSIGFRTGIPTSLGVKKEKINNNNNLSELVLLCKQSSNKMLHKGEPRFKLLCLHTATKAKQSNKMLQKGFGYPALTENITQIHIYLAEKRKIQIGDKMSGRHGNKGIVSQILPRQDMPYLPDGTPVDMVLNPLGVPSRMNVGQIFECLLGLAGQYLGTNFRIFPFDEIYGPEASRSFVFSKLYEARKKTGMDWLFDPNFPGKTRLFDGRTGDCFDQPVTVGLSYILKLVHLVDDKMHSRSTGPYSLVTQQPLRGRSKQGGQRLGEMEVWALEGYGAAFILLEMLTIKSDNISGRLTLWSNLLLNRKISFGTPESFKVLVSELQSLCLNIGLFS
jgi:DNA-directed RNA polymerase subunit beta